MQNKTDWEIALSILTALFFAASIGNIYQQHKYREMEFELKSQMMKP